MHTYRLGLVGLDTSHVTAFANLLHDNTHEHHVPGARIVAAYPGGSPDFKPSISRVEGFTNDLRDKHGVKIVDSIAQLKGECDAVFLESVDGRVHLEQFRQLADWNVPVFIDKPFTVSSADARAIVDLAASRGVRVMTASAIRFAEAFQAALKDEESGAVTGGDFFGPMAFQENCPGFYWYGIHSVEMLYATLGAGCREVTAIRNGDDHDWIVGKWADGRIGTLRGSRSGNNGFGGTVHREKRSRVFDVTTGKKPYYASLLDEILRFLSGENVIALEESLEIIRFIEAANESVKTGAPVLI